MGEVFVSIDIECDGPTPGDYSMLSLGAVAFLSDGDDTDYMPLDYFWENLEPLPGAIQHPRTMAWWEGFPEAWALATREPIDPKEATRRFVDWCNDLRSRFRYVNYVCAPTSFDFTFVRWYMMHFCDENPFQVIDMRSFIMGMRGCEYRKTRRKYWPKVEGKHTHVALEDAREQGLAFMKLLKESRG